MTVERAPIQPGQESVWDYPRPPRAEPTSRRVEVYFNGRKIAGTTRAIRVLETSHPPVFYIPEQDVLRECLQPTGKRTFCEFKGQAQYYNVTVDDRSEPNCAWCYPAPTNGYDCIARHIAFYPSKMERCLLDDEIVAAQEGDFYGGWITQEIVGPFKGAADTWHW